jgi:hypothetical protein
VAAKQYATVVTSGNRQARVAIIVAGAARDPTRSGATHALEAPKKTADWIAHP